MRISVAAFGILVVTAGIAPVHAEEYPWCVKMDAFTKNCVFSEYNECAIAAKNAESICVHNPDYKSPATAAARAKSGKPPNRQH